MNYFGQQRLATSPSVWSVTRAKLRSITSLQHPIFGRKRPSEPLADNLNYLGASGRGSKQSDIRRFHALSDKPLRWEAITPSMRPS